MNKITITISGDAGIGKTTLAYYIAAILNDDGFDVDVTDPDDPDELVILDNLDNKLNVMIEKVSVDIITEPSTKLAKNKTTGTPEYLYSSMGGSYWLPCKIIHALLPPNRLLVWIDPFDDGIGEEKLVDSDRIRYV
jgi:CO dehydrogenase nickel-insertion accessory protein CooC1